MQSTMPRCGRTAALVTAFFTALGLFVACGGGGGGGEPTPPVVIDLGVLSASAPTRISRSFRNPLEAFATVTALPSDGAFAFDGNDLPRELPGGQHLTIGVIFTPQGSGPASGLVTLRFTGGGAVRDVTFEMRATGEEVPWTVTPDPVDFGDVLPGEETVLSVDIRNDAALSTVTLSDAQMPTDAFTFVGAPLPLVVPPGATRSFSLRFAPTAVASHGGTLRLGAGDPGGPLDINLWANSSGSGEKIIDLGQQTLSGSDTPLLTVDVPADAISVTFEGTMGDGDVVGLRSLEGPGGKVYGNVTRRGVMPWENDKKTMSIHLPCSDLSGTQLVAGGGTYRFQLYRVSGSGTSMDVRVILERRAAGSSANAVLPLNVFLAPGLVQDASTAGNDTNLQGMLTEMGKLLATQQISLGDIDYYDIASASYNNVDPGEEDALFRLSSTAQKTRLNLFLVPLVWSGQLLGLSAAIDGPKRKGERTTGVVCEYADGQPAARALIAVHEISHYLGLWHTVESIGIHDEIGDTPNCPASSTSSTCPTVGGGLLMHWQGLGGTILSNGQGLVLRGHACMHPPGAGQSALRTKPQPFVLDEEARAFLESRGADWCGTSQR